MSRIIGRIAMYPKQISFVMAVATVALLQPVVTLADVQQEEAPENRRARRKCPFYGCPLLPRDVHYDTAAKEALESIRSQSREQLSDSDSSSVSSQESQEAMMFLESSGDADMATLTLIGYKGGQLSSQVNQDRAFVVSPFFVRENTTDEIDKGTCDAEDPIERRLLGVFDGHAPLGEDVSEYTVSNLPKLLSSKLDEATKKAKSEQEEEAVTKLALIETFVELDKKVPAERSGGCTASVVLQLGRKLYVANAGDSISFVVAYHKSTGTVQIVYKTREDKPHLPDERARVEAAGGRVYIPARGGTTRVLYTDPMTGVQNGLAMSRSIGDWEVGKFGVIPDPIVDVLDIPGLVAAQMASVNSCVVINELGETIMDACTADDLANSAFDDVHIFAVSATDGLTDYVTDDVIAKTLAASLFDDDGPHPLSACEQLISLAANGWYHAKQGRYRDDISIAVSKIRMPSS